VPASENNASNQNHWNGIDRDTFLQKFSDFDAAKANAAQARAEELHNKTSAPKNQPADVPLPDIAATADDLGLERKIPRHMQIWFAAGLGLLACVAALAQGFLGSTPLSPTKQQANSEAPAQDSEPPLNKLQQELAHQRNDEDSTKSIDSLGYGSKTSRHHRTQPPSIPHTASEFTPSDLLAELPGQLPAGSETSSELMRRYENDKARALITGSKMLAVNHSSFDLADLSSPKLPSQLSTLIQSTPKVLKAVSEAFTPGLKPSLAQSTSSFTPPKPFPALTPRPHAPGPLVLEGTAIPCVLLTELRSDLPGMVIAQVSEDVFDSLHAEVKVIPRGARLIGRYDSRITSGQQRLMASFHRLILPNGTSIELDRMEGGNADGSAGLKGDVDTHFWARFGQAFLTAGLARAAQPSITPPSGNGVAASVLGPNAAGQILIDTSRVDLQTSGLLQPTLSIHQGDPFIVMVNRDLALPALTND
jgi:type IV secretion system protein TrbI